MSPPRPNPKCSLPIVAAVTAATIGSVLAMGAALGGYLYDRLKKGT